MQAYESLLVRRAGEARRSRGWVNTATRLAHTRLCDLQADTIGADVATFGTTVTVVAGLVRNALLQPKHDVMAWTVDPGWIALQKTAHTATAEVPWVSTNDILAHLMYAGRGHVYDSTMVAFNLRGRIEGVTDSKAGNYLSVVMVRWHVAAGVRGEGGARRGAGVGVLGGLGWSPQRME